MTDRGGSGRPPASVERVRRLIERGLERYGRGELGEAVAEWESAILIDERNAEARGLIAFVREQLLGAGADGGDFVRAPATDETGRTGWALAEAPSPEREPPGHADAGAAEPSSGRAWGGHGLVEPVGIPGEPDTTPGHPMAEETTTDPGPQAIAAELESLEWGGGSSAAGALPGQEAGAGEWVARPDDGDFDAGPGRTSRRITIESQIPAMLAATMPAEGEPPPASVETWAEPGTPRAVAELGREVTRRVAGRGGGDDPPSNPSPLSGEAMLFADVAEDPGRAARKRAAAMVDRAREDYDGGNLEGAAEAAEFALSEGERAPPPGIAEVIEPARPLFHRIFEAYVGPGQGVPSVTLTAHEISAMTFDHRTGFVLSRIDGVMTVDDLLDVSGMGNFDSFRILASLLRAGIVQIT